MKIHARTPVILALALPALTGCDGTAVAPHSNPVEIIPEFHEPQPAAAKRMACQNNLKQMTLSISDRDVLGLIMHDASVDVDIGDELRAPGTFATGTFFGHMLAQQDGDACGVAYVEFDEAIDQGEQRIVGVVLAFAGATVHEELERRVLTFEGTAEICMERYGPCHPAQLTGQVEVAENQGLWKFQISHESRGSLEFSLAAQTYPLLPGQGQDAERLGLHIGPTPVWMDDQVIAWVRFHLTGVVGTPALEGTIAWRPSDPADGTTLHQVELGLLLPEGDGYRWLLHAVVHTERPVVRLRYSDIVLLSGSGLEWEDYWQVQEATYVYGFDGFRILDTSQ